MIGTTVRHYRIDAELGRGGMGAVFLAYDTKLHRHVALKVLPSEHSGDRLQRFEREARAVAALSHPNVVTIYSVEECDGLHFLTMEAVDGRPLTDVIGHGRMTIGQILAIAIPLADAVAAAHAHGIIHRDLKPGNVMLGNNGTVKVLDFGLAKLKQGPTSEAVNSLTSTEQLTQPHLVVGTPSYMSPEQAEGKRVDLRSDIFSLGVVLFEMAAGHRPFTGNTAVSIMSAIIKDTAPSLAELRSDLPPDLDRITRRCLAKDPERRYQSAGDLRNDLQDLRESVAATTPAAAHRAASISRRQWPLLAATGFALMAGAYFVNDWRRGSQSPEPRVHVRFEHLTSHPGLEWFPSLSPDGQWFVYSAEHSGNREIYLQSIGGQNAINLTRDPAADDQPVFSPNGEQIVFRSTRDGGGLFVMGRTGEAVRRISRAGFNPTWSPDGAQVAYATESIEVNPQNTEGLSEVWAVAVNGGEPKRIAPADAVQPSWSRQHDRIAFARRLGTGRNMDIWSVSLDGSAPAPVTSDAATDWNPVWSPDGKYLYFGSDRGGSMNLWRVAIDARSGLPVKEPEPITTPAPFLAHLTLSSDGRRLAYSSVQISQNIQKLSIDPSTFAAGSVPTSVTTGSRLWSSPDPSADGSSLAFYSRVGPEGDLYLMRADGTGFRQVTSDAAIDRVPRWSPDAQWIAFFSNRSGSLEIWRVRPDGSDLQQLTDVAGDAAMPVWSPDGSRLAVGTFGGPTGACIFDPERKWNEQNPRKLPLLEGDIFAVNTWSPDGTRLAGQAGFAMGIVLYSLRSGTYERLNSTGEWPVFMPDGRHILFVSEGKHLAVMDTETKEARTIFSVERDVIGPPRLTRDGRTAYFSRRVTEGDIWLVELEGDRAGQ